MNGTEYPVQPGDALRIEPADQHSIHNTGQSDLKLIFIKTPYLPDDRVDL
ncbi:MAG: cupin domain-containing protein [Chloroflexi bacterium]|nr:cupin domain-containing protein [Chloroflexota bacterium]